ncbi:MAG: DNA mismatch repair endonuclease MutL [Myxococcota bacterium]|nr:DNA mismatch repair endonuclease MutL [Myxococcota bacterium]
MVAQPEAGRIRVLAPDLANQIAAGEVVERPASVVKELVENAVDAEATRIEVTLRGAGVDEISVRDDGSGMTADEAVLALVRHATSKLASEEDLRRIATFGFRGEALPAIASVSRLRLATRRAADAEGAEVIAEDGEAPSVRPAGVPTGTTVTVRDLFHRTPARRKFLKSPRTELAACVRAVEALALGAPGVGFMLRHDGRLLRRFLPQARAADRVREVLPDATLHEIAGSFEGLDVLAFLSGPHEAATGSGALDTLVNGRRVSDRSVVAAVLASYEGTVERGRIPRGVVYLNLSPAAVDVNVHPRKEEVRFANPRQIYSALLHVLRAGLAAAPWRGALGPAAALPAMRPWEPSWRGPAPTWVGTESTTGEQAVPWTPATAVPDPVRQSPGAETGPNGAPAPRGVREAIVFSSLEPVGRLFLTYLVCEGDDRVVIVDQHAAHERVVFEDLRERLRSGPLPSQALLSAVPVPLPADLLAVLEDERDAIARLGFDAEPFGPDRALLRAQPVQLRGDPAAALRDTLESLRHGAGAEGGVLEAALATVACHSAVRAGKRMSDAEVRALLARMDSADFDAWCPHGRPAWAVIARAELERMFGRR